MSTSRRARGHHEPSTPEPWKPERWKPNPADLTFGYVEHLLCWAPVLRESLADIPETFRSIQELDRFAYARLGKRLIDAHDGADRSDTFESIRRLIAEQRRLSPLEVDCLMFSDAVKTLDPPVICSQAELARFVNRSVNTTGLVKKLKQEGTLRDYREPDRRGGKYELWFADPVRQETALREISRQP